VHKLPNCAMGKQKVEQNRLFGGISTMEGKVEIIVVRGLNATKDRFFIKQFAKSKIP
jgi:ribosomal protein S2